MASPSVTISREQFDILLERAQYIPGDQTPTKAELVKLVAHAEWEQLQLAAVEYARLCKALLNGGVDNATIKILIQATDAKTSSVTTEAGTAPNTTPIVTTNPYKGQAEAPESKPSIDSIDEERASSSDSGSIPNTPASVSSDEREFTNDYDPRSLVLQDIPELTTLLDITNVVRGGMILTMYLASHERAAYVTFVNGSAARCFMRHARRDGIYIKNRRINVVWAAQQYYLSGHIARRVFKGGATRNLLIRNAKADMTPGTICEELEHIYRLEVVSVIPNGRDLVISLNAIAHAITARNCMSSRFKYKGTRIDFAFDECNQALPPEKVKPRLTKVTIPVKVPFMQNRFQMLRLDDAGDGEEENVVDDELMGMRPKAGTVLQWA